MGQDRIILEGDGITAVISRTGAELQSLLDPGQRELLWQAGAAWPRRSPVLFPIVGKLAGDRLRHGAGEYRLTQHGFARDKVFRLVGRDRHSCKLSLQHDPETLAVYPFPFHLEVSYWLENAALRVGYAVTNPGDGPLYASLGAHPALRWPLTDGVPKEAHWLEFAVPERGPVRRLEGGLLAPATSPSPVLGRRLGLGEALFTGDALVFEQPASRSVHYAAENGAAVDMLWAGFEQLGLWSKPGGDFLCIEPWQGTASPAGWDGEFASKPGLMRLCPGETRTFEWSLRPCPH